MGGSPVKQVEELEKLARYTAAAMITIIWGLKVVKVGSHRLRKTRKPLEMDRDSGKRLKKPENNLGGSSLGRAAA